MTNTETDAPAPIVAEYAARLGKPIVRIVSGGEFTQGNGRPMRATMVTTDQAGEPRVRCVPQGDVPDGFGGTSLPFDHLPAEFAARLAVAVSAPLGDAPSPMPRHRALLL